MPVQCRAFVLKLGCRLADHAGHIVPLWHSIFMYNLNCRFASSHGRFAGFAGDDEDDDDGGTHYSVPMGMHLVAR